MGGSLSKLMQPSQTVGAQGAAVPLFGGAGSPVSGGPSLGKGLGQGALGGALKGFGQQPQQPQAGGSMIAPGPAATPVDPNYFAPSQQNPWNQQRPSIYG